MTNKQLRLWEFIKDFVSINLGMAIYSLGWAAFLLPYHITTGGVPGLLAIVYYLTHTPQLQICNISPLSHYQIAIAVNIQGTSKIRVILALSKEQKLLSHLDNQSNRNRR